jgi:hypothetical protein
LAALLAVMGAVTVGLARPASAWNEVRFRQSIPLLDAGLQSMDIFGSFWWNWGDLKLDTTWVMDDYGTCFVEVSALLNNRTLNYKTGFNHRMEAFVFDWVPCYVDPVDKTIRAKVPFQMLLRGPAGGLVDAKMRLVFTETGPRVTISDLKPADPDKPEPY